jgi:hypothetical protein
MGRCGCSMEDGPALLSGEMQRWPGNSAGDPVARRLARGVDRRLPGNTQGQLPVPRSSRLRPGRAIQLLGPATDSSSAFFFDVKRSLSGRGTRLAREQMGQPVRRARRDLPGGIGRGRLNLGRSRPGADGLRAYARGIDPCFFFFTELPIGSAGPTSNDRICWPASIGSGIVELQTDRPWLESEIDRPYNQRDRPELQ